MQRLYFEEAWDKTLAPADRAKIVNYFQKQAIQFEDGVHFSFLWKAINHKGERLVTVLIHNAEETVFRLENTVISYYEQDKQIAADMFTLPCEIAGKASMPWTFIFSTSNQINQCSQYTITNEEEHVFPFHPPLLCES